MPNDLDLFQARMLVAIADWLRGRDVLAVKQAEWSNAKMALGGLRDLDGQAHAALLGGARAKDTGTLLAAFWSHYGGELELYQAESRLLVNPPGGIKPNADWTATFSTQESLKGTYGELFATIPAAITAPSQLEDVTMFYGHQFSLTRDILSRIRPGSTITLAMPSEAHRFWMSWAEIDLKFDVLVQGVSQEWKVNSVHRVIGRNVTVEVLGVEL